MNSRHNGEENFTRALRKGILVNINEVENGLACQCECPNCGGRLVAYNNPQNKNAHHFKHYAKKCNAYYETMLHFLAKQFIQEMGKIVVPDLIYTPSKYAASHLHNSMRNRLESDFKLIPMPIEFDRIELEKHQVDVRPDLIGYIRGKMLLIEIAVTHFVDENKIMKIRKLGIPTLEIDLSGFDRNIHELKLKESLSGDISIMKWLYNPRLEKKKKSYSQEQMQLLHFIQGNQRSIYVPPSKRIDACPIVNNLEYIVSEDACDRCIFQVAKERVKSKEESYRISGWSSRPYIIKCIGHVSDKYEQLLGVRNVENKAFDYMEYKGL